VPEASAVKLQNGLNSRHCCTTSVPARGYSEGYRRARAHFHPKLWPLGAMKNYKVADRSGERACGMANADPICSPECDCRKRSQLRPTAHQKVGQFFELRVSFRFAPSSARGSQVERGPYAVRAAIRIRATIEQPSNPFPVEGAGGGVQRSRAIRTRGMNQRRIGSQDLESSATLPGLCPE
jgi:hypothetical protein